MKTDRFKRGVLLVAFKATAFCLVTSTVLWQYSYMGLSQPDFKSHGWTTTEHFSESNFYKKKDKKRKNPKLK